MKIPPEHRVERPDPQVFREVLKKKSWSGMGRLNDEETAIYFAGQAAAIEDALELLDAAGLKDNRKLRILLHSTHADLKRVAI